MLRSLIFSLLALTQVIAVALPADRDDTDRDDYESSYAPHKGMRKCKDKLLIRRAWHNLSNDEKREYLDAELCLMSRPTQTHLGAARTRFDDMIKAHQLQTHLVHDDGWFLPFHRLYTLAHEKLLREECGYKGAQPYWEEIRDSGNFNQSIIFDTEYGFGGDGQISLLGQENNATASKCIVDGPFADYLLRTGPGMLDTEHCIRRWVNDTASLGVAQVNIDECMAMETYDLAWKCWYLKPHRSGHQGVGGEMSDQWASPGDPTFHLHHAWLDRLWWNWQRQDLPKRYTDFGGYTTRDKPATGWVNATLDDVLHVYGIIPNATIAELMDVEGEVVCGGYEDPDGNYEGNF